MSRNYIAFWSSKINNGGNFQNSVIEGTFDACAASTRAVLDALPGATLVWENKAGFFLYDKANLIALLKVPAVHYSGFFAST